jgi:hypothetical protein
MLSAVLCYSIADADAAREIGGFLEQNCPVAVSYDEAVIRPGFDLVDAADRAISADVAILLLSPESVPAAWRRDRWEPILFEKAEELGTEVAFVVLRDCKFPELFRRKSFYDARRGLLPALRSVNRMVLALGSPSRTTFGIPQHDPQCDAAVTLEELRTSLADRPGCATCTNSETALAFIDSHEEDFEGIFWVSCADRSRTGILGNIGYSLGLKLAGPAEENRDAILKFLSPRRCLLVLEQVAPADREFVPLGGKTSILFIDGQPAPARRSKEETMELFSRWPSKPEECLAALGEARFHLEALLAQAEHGAGEQLGFAIIALLEHHDRLAEADEVLAILARAKRDTGDTMALHRILWKQGWIRERWGEAPAPAPADTPDPEQMSFDFSPPRKWIRLQLRPDLQS